MGPRSRPLRLHAPNKEIGDAVIDIVIDVIILALLAAVAAALVTLRNLFAVVMFFGSYTFLSAILFVTLDAVDVAFTEAAVGAGIATILILATLALTTAAEKPVTYRQPVALLAVFITGAALVHGTLELPPMGDPNSPVHQHVAPRYIEQSPKEVGIPNMVTSVLASYRGFDTFGEVVVIFTAAVGVLSILGWKRPHASPSRSREDKR